jgi:hypothetical protein
LDFQELLMADKSKDSELADLVPKLPAEDIKGLILTIRGRQVLLDSDVARLYGYETKYINQAAKRNEDRFPERYRFQLTLEEAEQISSKSQIVTLNANMEKAMRSQIVTASKRNERHLPFAYSEHGVSMLAGLLRSPTAVQVSLGIIDAFIEMRQFLNANHDVFAKLVRIDNKLLDHDRKFDEVFDLLQTPDTVKQSVFYKGQFYDAFKLVIGIIKSAKKSLIIIDNYADDSVLDMLTQKNNGVSVAVVTSNPGKLSQQSLTKFSSQYGQLQIVECKDFHDRFIISDSKDVYAFGASIKDLGKKCFGIWKMEDNATQFVTYVNQTTGTK